MATKQKPQTAPQVPVAPATDTVEGGSKPRGPSLATQAETNILHADADYMAAREGLGAFFGFLKPAVAKYARAKDEYTLARNEMGAAQESQIASVCRDWARMTQRMFALVPDTRTNERHYRALCDAEIGALTGYSELTATYKVRCAQLKLVAWNDQTGVLSEWAQGQYDPKNGLVRYYEMVRNALKIAKAGVPDDKARRKALATDAIAVRAAVIATGVTAESWPHLRAAIDKLIAERTAKPETETPVVTKAPRKARQTA